MNLAFPKHKIKRLFSADTILLRQISRRLFYNLKGFYILGMPNYENIQNKILAFLNSLNEEQKAYIKSRVNYYHKTSKNFKISNEEQELQAKILQNDENLRICKAEIYKLKNLLFEKISSVYKYDFREYSRYFDGNLKYFCGFGDVNYYFFMPSLCKSRPIGKDGEFLFLNNKNWGGVL